MCLCIILYVLLSGDGNDNKGRASFDKVVREAVLDWGWKVEVWCWRDSCGQVYRSLAQAINSISLYLDAYVDQS